MSVPSCQNIKAHLADFIVDVKRITTFHRWENTLGVIMSIKFERKSRHCFGSRTHFEYRKLTIS